MAIAICINCGHRKTSAIDVCDACDFLPQSGEDKAKSLILSTEYDVGDEYLGYRRRSWSHSRRPSHRASSVSMNAR